MPSFLEKQLPTLAKLINKRGGGSEPDPIEPDSREPSSRDEEPEETGSSRTLKMPAMPAFKRPSFNMPKGPSLSLGGSKKSGGTVGLEIESGTIAATEIGSNGAISHTAITELPPGIVTEGEVQDPAALSEALKDMFSRHKLSRQVRLGIANQRVVVRMLRLPLIEKDDELETAIRFQATDHIPMPLEQAVLDYEVVGKHNDMEGGERNMDVVAVAARRDMIAVLLDALRNAGLRPVGIDLAAFGMIRALKGLEPPTVEGAAVPTVLYCHLGDVTNLAVAREGQCLFTRVAPFGVESMAARVAEKVNMTIEDARDVLMDIGLEGGVNEFAQDQDEDTVVRAILDDGATKFADELRVSLEFYSSQEGAAPVDRVVLCGPGSAIPGLSERIEQELGLDIEDALPQALSGLDPEQAARLTVSYGLGLEE